MVVQEIEAENQKNWRIVWSYIDPFIAGYKT